MSLAEKYQRETGLPRHAAYVLHLLPFASGYRRSAPLGVSWRWPTRSGCLELRRTDGTFRVGQSTLAYRTDIAGD